MPDPIYGHIENTKDISKINRKIRSEIKSAQDRPRLTELVNRSKYLVTLMYSPNLKKRHNISALRKRAKSEKRKTAKAANARLKRIYKKPQKKYKV